MSGQGFRSGFIVIVGCPNVGKSTLLNRILNRKLSIISPKPQTTRNRILGVKHLEGAQLIFIDTPGVHAARTRLNQHLVATALRTLKEADLILYITAPMGVREEDERIVLERLREANRPTFLAINKIDLVPKEEVLPLIERYRSLHPFREIVPISALRGTQVDLLVELVEGAMPAGPPYFPPDTVTDMPEHLFIAELIREQVLHSTHQEIPYATAVVVDAVEERGDGTLYIAGTIFVERDSQKGIVIGKGGRMLERIGKGARLEIERLLGCRVYLQLWVKVRERWSSREGVLREWGYAGQ